MYFSVQQKISDKACILRGRIDNGCNAFLNSVSIYIHNSIVYSVRKSLFSVSWQEISSLLLKVSIRCKSNPMASDIRQTIQGFVLMYLCFSLLYSKTWVCRGLLIFLSFAPKHRLWVFTCSHSLCFEQKSETMH